MKTIQQRIHWIDWAKVIGIFLVIYGHAPGKGHLFIYMFHMPFFFMISGYLYKRTSVKSEIKKTFYSLIMPYLLYNIILVVCSILLGDFQYSILLNILLGNQESIGIKYFNPLWFLISLFMIRIITATVYNYLLIFSLFCMIISSILYSLDLFSYETDIYQIATSIICFPFFIFGHLIKSNHLLFSYQNTKNKFLSSIIFFVIVCLTIVIGYYNGPINIFRATNAGKSIFLFYVVGFVLSYSLLLIIASMFNVHNKVITTLSNGTIFILCTHSLFIYLASHLFKLNTLKSIILSLFICFVSYLVIQFCQKHLPLLIGKRE